MKAEIFFWRSKMQFYIGVDAMNDSKNINQIVLELRQF